MNIDRYRSELETFLANYDYDASEGERAQKVADFLAEYGYGEDDAFAECVWKRYVWHPARRNKR